MKKKFSFPADREMASIILTLAWPTMLEQLMQTAVQYIDTAMVGSLGTAATAAVGATSTINWLISSTLSALSIGFLSFISRSFGSQNEEHARRIAAQAVVTALTVGIFLTVVVTSLSGQIPALMQVDPDIRELASKYFFVLYLALLPRTATIMFGTVLRAAGDTKTPMKIGLFVNMINVILNTLLIYPTQRIRIFSSTFLLPGAGLGVIGAAMASAIAFAFGGICTTVILWKHPRISPRKQSFRPDPDILKPCLKVAFPSVLQMFFTSLGHVCFASMINSLGAVSSAAHTIANTVESAFYIPGYGMQTAAATLAGNAYGAKDKSRLDRLAAIFIPIELTLMLLSSSLLFLFSPTLIRIFSDSPEVIQLGTTVLRMVAFSEPLYGFSIIVEGMMQGVGRTKRSFVYNVTGMWLIRNAGTLICTQFLGLGLISAWTCMILHNTLVFLLFLRTYLRGSWNPLKETAAY